MTFLLQQALTEPEVVPHLAMPDLALLVSQARIARLLPTLALRLQETGGLTALPACARRHFESAQRVHEKQRRDLGYDCAQLRRALASCDEQLVLLKGAAYLQGGLPAGAGRLITDIDIIVPRERLAAAERALNEHGWETSALDPYDERYYRRWSHETPALVNRRRGTTLDLHHNILPPTAAPGVDAALLFTELQEVSPGIYTLSHRDMIIHSATHLFHEGEFHHGLRDLWDLDRLLRSFAVGGDAAWDSLLARAAMLELQAPLYLALKYTRSLFGTPVPTYAIGHLENFGRALRAPLTDFLFRRALRPDHPSCRLAYTGPALAMLYLRSHYLRMPLYLLLPHLLRKAWMRLTRRRDAAAATPRQAA